MTGERAALVHKLDSVGVAVCTVNRVSINTDGVVAGTGNSVVDGVYLTPDYKMQLQEAIAAGKDSFDYVNEEGATETYMIDNKNGQY
ncbi:MAG: hypothetical protein II319_01760, partial [Clostridia bacterium]|nr:hypothetical protein [Clostridia bacterium]